MQLQARWQVIVACIGILFLSLLVRQNQQTSTIANVNDTFAKKPAFREGVVGKPQYLNPLLAHYNPVDEDITALLFEGLVKQSSPNTFTPVLAESWTISDNRQIYTFTLKKNVFWSDGVLFTSEDVALTYSLIQANDFSGSPSLQKFWQTVAITVIDSHTIQFSLSEPFPAFISYTSSGIVPKHILGHISGEDLLTHKFNLAPIGTGPYILTKATDSQVQLQTNPAYHGEKSQLEFVEFVFFGNNEERIQAFQNGQLDAFGTVEWPSTETQKQVYAMSNVQIHHLPLQRYSLIYLNQRNDDLPFFQDSAVRQALLRLLNRQKMADDLFNGQTILVDGPILRSSWAFNPNQLGLSFDPDEAALLLEEVGWRDEDSDDILEKEEIPFSFTLLVDDDPDKIRLANEIVKQWGKFYIHISVEITNDITQRLASGDYEAALVEIQLNADPDMYAYWHQSQIDTGQNYGSWQHQSASQTLRQGRLASSQNERMQFYYAFQNIFTDEVPAILLYQPVYTYIVRNNVSEIQLSELAKRSTRFNNVQTWLLNAP